MARIGMSPCDNCAGTGWVLDRGATDELSEARSDLAAARQRIAEVEAEVTASQTRGFEVAKALSESKAANERLVRLAAGLACEYYPDTPTLLELTEVLETWQQPCHACVAAVRAWLAQPGNPRPVDIDDRGNVTDAATGEPVPGLDPARVLEGVRQVEAGQVRPLR